MLYVSAFTELLGHTLFDGRLGDVLLNKSRNGWSARCDNMPQGTPVLSLGAITGFKYQETEFKLTSEPTDQNAHYFLASGDLLITRSNTPELVGHAAIYSGVPAPCIYPDLMMRLDVNTSRSDKKFVHHWLASTPVGKFIRTKMKGTSPTMKKISQGVVMNISFPSKLSLTEQERFVSYLDKLQAQLATAKHFRKNTLKELDTLLPAILDQAFKGEL